jgi:hypothetical protein
MGAVLAYAAAGLVALWGVAHVIPTRAVITGYGPISTDNRRVLTQEWLAEAVAMWSLAAIVVAVTAADKESSAASWVYRVVAAALLALAVLTAVTGARTRVIWFKVCPVLLATSAALLLAAGVV